jgi:hypothetical protein
MFLIRAIGIDRLTLAFEPPTPAPFQFDLSRLEDEELAELTRLLAKVQPEGVEPEAVELLPRLP